MRTRSQLADDLGTQAQQHRRARLGRGLAHQIDRLDHQRLQIDLLGAQLEPALDQARHVEQLIDELVEADHLPPDRGQPPEHPLVGGARGRRSCPRPGKSSSPSVCRLSVVIGVRSS